MRRLWQRRLAIGSMGTLAFLGAAAATGQRTRVPPAPTATATFDALDPGMMGYLMVLKFNRVMLNADRVAQLGSLFINRTVANCQEAAAFRNEFDAAAATANARARLNRYLDALPPRIEGEITFDLGDYDRAVGGFPIGNRKGDGLLHAALAQRTALTAFGRAPTNVGNNYAACGVSPYPRQRVQVRLDDQGPAWWGYLLMPEAAARAYVASHAGQRRQIDVASRFTVLSVEEEANRWSGRDPALIYNLKGRRETIEIRDAVTHRVLPGRVIFRDTANEVIG